MVRDEWSDSFHVPSPVDVSFLFINFTFFKEQLMLTYLSWSSLIRGAAVIAVGIFLLGSTEAFAQQIRLGNTHGGYYNGLGGRYNNHSQLNFGSSSLQGRQYSNRNSGYSWGPQYNQRTSWRAAPSFQSHQRFPSNSAVWGQSRAYNSFGTGRYYGTGFNVNQSSYYNPFGQTRYYW
jgi:hypothetical protein